ncbi:hypothetical protein D3C81_1955860 [compost metagenome]
MAPIGPARSIHVVENVGKASFSPMRIMAATSHPKPAATGVSKIRLTIRSLFIATPFGLLMCRFNVLASCQVQANGTHHGQQGFQGRVSYAESVVGLGPVYKLELRSVTACEVTRKH